MIKSVPRPRSAPSGSGFLGEIEEVVQRKARNDLLDPHYPKTISKGDRLPCSLATMLRTHLQQQWYNLSDQEMKDALIKVPKKRRFVVIDIISDQIPNEIENLAFRHLLEKPDLLAWPLSRAQSSTPP